MVSHEFATIMMSMGWPLAACLAGWLVSLAHLYEYEVYIKAQPQ